MNPTPLRYAIVGAGGVAHSHAREFLKKPAVSFVGFADPSPASRAKMNAEFADVPAFADPAEMLAAVRPDVVSVCTPNKFHREATLLALRHGAHVVCEKPMAMTVAEAEEMEAARAAAGKLGAINFSYRNNGGFRFVRALIASGELGRIFRVNTVYLQSWLGAPEARWAWRNDRTMAGFGTLGDLGIHQIDGVRFVTGLDYRRVVGVAQTLIAEKLDATGTPRPVTTDTNASFMAEMDGGVLAIFETSQCAPGYGNHFRIEVSGERGTVAVLSDLADRYWISGGSPFAARFGTWRTDLVEHALPTQFAATQPPTTPAAIVHALRGETVAYPDFNDGLHAQRVLEGIGRSMETAAWVTL